MYNINEKVAELIKAHGYESKVVEDSIVSNFKEDLLLSTNVNPQKGEAYYTSRFDIAVSFTDGRVLYESFGDYGKTEEEVIGSNLSNFTVNSFHVMLNAFNDIKDEEIVREEWEINNKTYDVFIGNLNMRSSTSIELPEDLYTILKTIIQNQDLSENYHFVRFFYGHHDFKTQIIEFMIDNKNIEKAEEELGKANWTKSEEYYSVRNFMILKKK